MTREEAKEILEEVKAFDDSIFQYNQNYMDALDMAIKALEQEPCDDCIRKQDEIRKAYDRGIKNGLIKGDALSEIEKMPILDKIRAEIHASAVMKPDYEWYVNEKRIMQIIDRYRQED